MRKLVIECFDKDNTRLKKIVAARVDATNSLTIISTTVNQKESETIRWPNEIDHWNIIDGMVTIYYKNGNFIEITRIYD